MKERVVLCENKCYTYDEDESYVVTCIPSE